MCNMAVSLWNDRCPILAIQGANTCLISMFGMDPDSVVTIPRVNCEATEIPRNPVDNARFNRSIGRFHDCIMMPAC